MKKILIYILTLFLTLNICYGLTLSENVLSVKDTETITITKETILNKNDLNLEKLNIETKINLILVNESNYYNLKKLNEYKQLQIRLDHLNSLNTTNFNKDQYKIIKVQKYNISELNSTKTKLIIQNNNIIVNKETKFKDLRLLNHNKQQIKNIDKILNN